LSETGTVVEQTVRIGARPETVWRYWTDPARMCTWWGQAADLDPRPGGVCVVDLGGGAVMRGEYLELVPYERLVFSLGWDPVEGGPDVPPGSTRVEVTLAPDGDGTVLTVRHIGLPASQVADHAGGWAHFLGVLAEVAS
jgi:uncharacterized protein YndB with AHSA1/START domain